MTGNQVAPEKVQGPTATSDGVSLETKITRNEEVVPSCVMKIEQPNAEPEDPGDQATKIRNLVAELGAKQQANFDLTEEMTIKDSEIGNLNTQLKAQKETTDLYKAQVDRLKAEKAKLQEDDKKQKSEIEEKNKNLDKLQKTLESLKKDFEAEKVKLREEASEKNQTLDQLKKDLETEKKTSGDWKTQLEQMKSQNNTLQSESQAFKDLQETHDENLLKLTNQSNDLKDLEAKLTESNKELETVKANLALKEEQLQTQQGVVTVLRSDLEHREIALNRVNDVLVPHTEALNEKLGEEKKVVAYLRQSCQQLLDEKQVFLDQETEFEENIEQKALDVIWLDAKFKVLGEERKKLLGEKESFEKDKKEYEKLKAEIGTLQSSEATLKKKVSEVNGKLEALQEEMKKNKEEAAEKMNELNDLNLAFEKFKKDKAAELQDLTSQNSALKTKNEQFEKNQADDKAMILKLTTEKADLQKEPTKSKEELQNIQKQINSIFSKSLNHSNPIASQVEDESAESWKAKYEALRKETEEDDSREKQQWKEFKNKNIIDVLNTFNDKAQKLENELKVAKMEMERLQALQPTDASRIRQRRASESDATGVRVTFVLKNLSMNPTVTAPKRPLTSTDAPETPAETEPKRARRTRTVPEIYGVLSEPTPEPESDDSDEYRPHKGFKRATMRQRLQYARSCRGKKDVGGQPNVDANLASDNA